MPRTQRLIINDETAVYHAWDVEPKCIGWYGRYRGIRKPTLVSVFFENEHNLVGIG